MAKYYLNILYFDKVLKLEIEIILIFNFIEFKPKNIKLINFQKLISLDLLSLFLTIMLYVFI